MPFDHPHEPVSITADGAALATTDLSVSGVAALARHAIDGATQRLELLGDLADPGCVDLALACGFGYEGLRRNAAGAGRHLVAFARTADDPGTAIAPAFPAFDGDGLADDAIVLREASPEDLEAVCEIDADPQTLAYGFGAAPSRDDTAAMLAMASLRRRVGPDALFTLVDRATDRCAGTVRLRRNGPPQVAMFGYAVHPRFRGRGYTSRALRLLSAWAFAEAGVARLELGARHDNVASQRAALAAGFLPDGIMRARLRAADGTFRDEARFYLLPDHVGAQPSPPSRMMP